VIQKILKVLPDHASVFPVEHSQDESEQGSWFIPESRNQIRPCDFVEMA